MGTDEFQFDETVSALANAIALTILAASPEHRADFIARLKALIDATEEGSHRNRVYRYLLREVEDPTAPKLG